MFESSMANMEAVAAKVGGLEGQLQTAASDVERANSEKRVVHSQNDALRADLKRVRLAPSFRSPQTSEPGPAAPPVPCRSACALPSP
eukprot:SAG22_NODE_155_length_17123_cov_37.528489_5_plen_87_part_00